MRVIHISNCICKVQGFKSCPIKFDHKVNPFLIWTVNMNSLLVVEVLPVSFIKGVDIFQILAGFFCFCTGKHGRLNLCDTGGKTPVPRRYSCRVCCKSKPAIGSLGLLCGPTLYMICCSVMEMYWCCLFKLSHL